MSPPSPSILVVSESGIARGFAQVILRAEGLEAREVFTPAQVRALLRPSAAEPGRDAVLLIDASLLGRVGPRGDIWGRLVRDHPELPVVCLKLEGDECAPPELSGRVRAHVEPMEPLALVGAVRGALRRRTLSAPLRIREERSAG